MCFIKLKLSRRKAINWIPHVCLYTIAFLPFILPILFRSYLRFSYLSSTTFSLKHSLKKLKFSHIFLISALTSLNQLIFVFWHSCKISRKYILLVVFLQFLDGRKISLSYFTPISLFFTINLFIASDFQVSTFQILDP